MGTVQVSPRRSYRPLDVQSYRAPGGGGPPQYSADMQTGDPYEMYKGDRRSWYDRGNRLDQDLRDEEQFRASEENRYGQAADTAYDYLAEEPGYTQQESEDIRRTRQYETLPTSQEDFDRMNMTDEEWAAARGDTNSYYNWFDPAYQEDIDRAGAAAQRGEYQGAIGRMDTAISDQDAAMQGAVDPNRLRQNAGYGKQQFDAVGSAERNVRGAIDPTKLGLSGRFLDNYGMTDENVQSRATEGAQRVSNRYRSAIGELQQAALEAGNASPLAVGAMRGRYERQSAVDESLASLAAKNAARQEQADRERAIEQMRLGSEQTQAGMLTDAELALAQQRLNTGRDIEAQRLAAEQGYTDRAVDIAKETGRARRDVGEFAGTVGTGIEKGIADRAANTQQYITDRGTDIAQNKDIADVDRARYDYETRRGNQQYRNDTRFGQGMQVQDRLSGGAQTVADARRTGQQQYRDYVAGSRDKQADLGTTARDQRIKNYGVQSGAVNQATQGMSDYDINRRNQSWGAAIKKGVSGAISNAPSAFGKKKGK